MSGQAYVETLISDNARDALLPLLTIYHPDLAEPIRLVRDNRDIVSRGQTFRGYPFDVARPGAGTDGASPARLVIDNLDRRIVETVRAVSSSPSVLIETVAASAPDTVEEVFPVLKIASVDADRLAVEAVLTDIDDYSEPVCRYAFSPSLAPALFS